MLKITAKLSGSVLVAKIRIYSKSAVGYRKIRTIRPNIQCTHSPSKRWSLDFDRVTNKNKIAPLWPTSLRSETYQSHKIQKQHGSNKGASLSLKMPTTPTKAGSMAGMVTGIPVTPGTESRQAKPAAWTTSRRTSKTLGVCKETSVQRMIGRTPRQGRCRNAFRPGQMPTLAATKSEITQKQPGIQLYFRG